MPDTTSPEIDPRSALAARLTGPGGPFELAPEDHGRGPVASFSSRPQTLADLYARARAFRDKTFILSDARTLSYAQLFARADQLAAALAGAGFAPGDRVALAVENKIDWIAAFVAVTALGGAAVLLDASEDGLGPAIVRTACKLGVADTAGAGAAVTAATGLPALAPASGDAVAAPAAASIEPADIALIAFTSGSSGTPKGVLVDHRGLITGLRGMLLGGALQSAGAPATPRPVGAPPPPCALVTSPLFHVGGYAQVLLAMMTGGKVALARGRASADELAAAVTEHGVTALGGVTPALVRGLLDARASGADLGSLRTVRIQGAHLPEDLFAQLKRDLPDARISGGYGMTEANGSIAVSSEADLAAGLGRGFPLPTAKVRVIDSTGADLAPGRLGDIVVSGAMLARGYLGSDGGFKPLDALATGDVGALDPDGALRVLDRRENCRWFGDRLVSCREIEALVMARPEARAAHAAFTTSGPGIEVWVVADGENEALRDHLTAAVVEGLPAEATPVRVAVVSELPLTASGKVRRAGLVGAD